MVIRPYQPGDEAVQVEIYNAAAAALPGFKPAKVEELARRYGTVDSDPSAKLYAVEEGEVVGYATFSANGRVSFPWCRAGAEALREPLFGTLQGALRRHGHDSAFAAYRADWEPVLAFFRAQGFEPSRQMINYVADLATLPHMPVPEDRLIRPLAPCNLPQLVALGEGVLEGSEPALADYFWKNAYFDGSSLFALAPAADPDRLLGAALLVINPAYADPAKIDAAMPCFRLGAFATESQRHKRVNGLFSCLFHEEPAGEILLAEAVRRLESAEVPRLAAQVPSDRPGLVAFHDRYLRRQDSFPILARVIP